MAARGAAGLLNFDDFIALAHFELPARLHAS
jgi:hypothetical protein